MASVSLWAFGSSAREYATGRIHMSCTAIEFPGHDERAAREYGMQLCLDFFPPPGYCDHTVSMVKVPREFIESAYHSDYADEISVPDVFLEDE